MVAAILDGYDPQGFYCEMPRGTASFYRAPLVRYGDLIRVAVVCDPRQAVPVSGTGTGFPSDHLGMTVAVEVTAGDGKDVVERAAARRSQVAG